MHELLKKFWKNNDSKYLMQPITLWLGELPEGDYRNEEAGIKGFIFEDHIGLEVVKELAGKGLYVYAMRHGDDWCEPASIETKEVIVNFYAYLVVDEPLDFLFKDGKDWSEDLADWTMDWGDEYYWV
jgi:hypothetical protein